MSEPISEKRRHGYKDLIDYLAKAGDVQRVQQALLNFKFIALKCDANMHFDVLDDFDRATALQVSPAVAQLCHAYGIVLPLLAQRPELTAQLLYNQLRWLDGRAPDLDQSLTQIHAVLSTKKYWLEASAPLPGANTSATSYFPLPPNTVLQAVAMDTTDGPVLAAATSTGDVEIYALRSGKFLKRRQLATRTNAFTITNDGTVFAYAIPDGTIHTTNSAATLAGRPNETHLLCLSLHELVGVRNDNVLVCWNHRQRAIEVLATDLPAPLIALKATPDNHSFVFVAGHTNQRLGWAVREAGGWAVKMLPYHGPPLRCATLDPSGTYILLASLDRRLLVMRLASGEIVAQLSYEQAQDVPIRGRPAQCALEAESAGGRAFIATQAGDLACWNWATGQTTWLESYRGVSEVGHVTHLDLLPLLGRLICITETTARLLSLHALTDPLPRHNARVTQCAITAAGEVVSVSEHDSTIRWWTRTGLQPLAIQPQLIPPSTVTPIGNSASVVVGDQQGGVGLRGLSDRQAFSGMGTSLGEPLVSVFYGGNNCPEGGTQCVFLGGRSGKVVAVDFATRRQGVIYHPPANRTQIKLLPSAAPALCWSIYRDQEQKTQGFESVIARVTGVDTERRVFATSLLINDVAVAPLEEFIAVATTTTRVFARHDEEWLPCYERSTQASHLAFLDGRLLAVILAGEPWLEIWRIEVGLPTIAAIELLAQPECLTSRDYSLVVGLRSGELMSLTLRAAGWV